MRRPLCLVCLAFVITTAIYVWLLEPPSFSLLEREGETINVTGEVYQKKRQNDTLLIYLNHVTFRNDFLRETEKVKGIVCCLEGGPEPPLGSKVSVTGKASMYDTARNPGEFDVRTYYQRMDLDFCLKDAYVDSISSYYKRMPEQLYQWKKKFGTIYDSVFAPKDAGIIKAMVLGEKEELDRNIKDVYQKSGIAHILTISGLHISMLGMALFGFCRKLHIPLPVAALLSFLFLYLYGTMVGMGNSQIRALWMFSVFLLAKLCRRTYDALTAMASASVFLLIMHPSYVFYAGFQLSFGAVMGIVLLAPLAEKILMVCGSIQNAAYRNIVKILSGSLGVTLATLPIILYNYYEFPLLSFLLNLFVIPLLSLLIGLALLILVVGQASLIGGIILSYPCHIILQLYEKLSTYFLNIPGNIQITGRPEFMRILIYYLMVGFLAAGCKHFRRIYILLGLSFSVLVLVEHPPDGLQITMLDVGQGDGIFIESDTGIHIFLDGGSSSKSKITEYQIVPFLKSQGVQSIDYWFISHKDIDHTLALQDILKAQLKDGRGYGIQIQMILLPEVEADENSCQEIAALAEDCGIAVRFLSRGDAFALGHLKGMVLHPDWAAKNFSAEGALAETLVAEDVLESGLSANDASMVLYLEYKDFTGVFTGDIEKTGEKQTMKALEDIIKEKSGRKDGICLLKVAHHGSNTSSTEEFLQLLKPDIALISCGQNNSYGHPHKEVLERIGQISKSIYATKDRGAVTFLIKEGRIICRPMF